MALPRTVRLRLGDAAAILSSRDYRRLWLAAVVSRAGDAVNFVALPLFAYAATRSPAAVGALVVVEGAALILGSAAAQLVVDRVEPRRLLVAADLGRAAAAASLALLPSFPLALAVTGALAVGTSWFSPTSSALIPRLVDEAELGAANALQWTAGVVLGAAAAPVGGLLVTHASARVAFALNALSFAGSAIILARLAPRPPLAVATSPWRQLPETLAAVAGVRVLPPLLLVQALAALAAGATSALLVVLAQSAYGLSGTGYGLWLAAVAAGALTGPLVVPALLRLSPAGSVSAAFLVRGAGDIGLGTLSNGVVGGALLFIYGLNTSSGMVAFQTLVQRAVPARLRGRCFALLDVTWQTARLVSVGAGGGVAAAAGIRPVFVAGGCLLLVAGVAGALTLTGGYPAGEMAGGAQG